MTAIARNADSKGDLIAWWDDAPLEGAVQVTCANDEVVVFVVNGKAVLQLQPGRHALTPRAQPALAAWLTGKDDTVAVAFLTTTSVDVEVLGGHAWGEDEAAFGAVGAVRVIDGKAVIGMLDQLGEDEALEDWLGDEVGIHVSDAITAKAAGIVDVTSGAMNGELLKAAVPLANELLHRLGFELVSLRELEFELEPQTAKRLKQRR
jgi:hypothetical protein